MVNSFITNSSPYIGPRPFERRDRLHFFGRDSEAAELIALIIARRVVVLYAPSGAGKTSLLNALVVPQLENNDFEVFPLARVQGAVQAHLNSVVNPYLLSTIMSWSEAEEKQEYLTQLTIDDYLTQQEPLEDKYGQPAPRVLIFDQFEELFTAYPTRWEERTDFFRQLDTALTTDPLLRIVFSMREDYLAQLDPYAKYLPDNLRHSFRLERMRPSAALTAITGPLQVTDRKYAPGVAEKLVEELRQVRVETAEGTIIDTGEFIEPVQLQVVCQNLWRSLPPDITIITRTDIETYGDVNQALAKFYENVLRKTKQETHVQESEIRDWFEKKLITPAGTRGIVFQDQEKGETDGLPNNAVSELESAHIIRGDIRAGSRWYELTHDRFVEPIQKSNEIRRQQQRQNLLKLGSGIIGILLLGVLILLAINFSTQSNANEAVAVAEETVQYQLNRTLTVVSETGEAALIATATRTTATAVAAIATEAYNDTSTATFATAAANATSTAEAYAQSTANALATKTAISISLTEIARATQDAQATITFQELEELERLSQPIRPLRPGISIGVSNQSTASSLSGFVHDEHGNIYLVTLAQVLGLKDSVILQPSLIDGGTQDNAIALSQIRESLEETSQPIQATDLIGFARLNAGISTTITIPELGPVLGIRAPQMGERVRIIGRSSSISEAFVVSNAQNELYEISLPYLANSVQVRGSIAIENASLNAGDLGALVLGEDGFALGIIIAIESETLMVPIQDVLVNSDKEFLHFGQRIITFDEHDREIEGISFSPNGRWLASVSKDKRAILWDMHKQDPFREPAYELQKHPFGIWDVEFSYDNSYLVTAGIGGYAYLWKLTDGNPNDSVVTLLSSQDDFRVGDLLNVEFSSDGFWLAIAGADADAYLWNLQEDIQSNSPTFLLPQDSLQVNTIRFSPDGKWLATARQEGVVRLWDLSRNSIDNFIPLDNVNESPTILEFSPDGRWLAIGGVLGTINVWDMAQPKPEKKYSLLDHRLAILSLAFSPDSRWLASGSEDNTGLLWDFSGESPSEAIPICSSYMGWVKQILFSLDGSWIVTGDESGSIRLSNFEQISINRDCIELGKHSDPIRVLAFSPDGNWLVSGGGSAEVLTGDDKAIRIWQIK